MRPEYQKYQQIDDYLNNRLSGEELMQFEERIKQDAMFREEVQDLKLTNEVILEHRFFEIADTLNPSLVSSTQLISETVKKILGIGGGSIAVVASLIYLNQKNEPKQTDNIVPVTVERKVEPAQEAIEVMVDSSHVIPSDSIIKINEENVMEERSVKSTTVKAEQKTATKSDASYLIKIPLDTVIAEIHHFNMEKTEKWSIPSLGANVVLKIFDKAGNEIYRKEFDSKQSIVWNGTSKEGDNVKSGKYIFLLDNGGKEVQHGVIMVKASQ